MGMEMTGRRWGGMGTHEDDVSFAGIVRAWD